MCLQTIYLMKGQLDWAPAVGLCFFCTFFLYGVHRTVGLEKVKGIKKKDRFEAISKYRYLIRVLAGVGAIGMIAYFFIAPRLVQIALLLPGILSMAYVLPLFRGGKRLRDLGYLKIFLIAFVWAWVTVLLPVLESPAVYWTYSIPLFLERMLFIFAITIPFDVRDLKIDAHTSVTTLPALLGTKKAIRLALVALFFAFLLTVFQWATALFYDQMQLFAMGFFYLITAILVSRSDKMQHDYYFSGVIDGLMLLQFGLVVLIS